MPTEKDEWIDENIDLLVDDFINDNEGEFNEYLENEVIDEERDLDYWKRYFCKELMEEDFESLCNYKYDEKYEEKWQQI